MINESNKRMLNRHIKVLLFSVSFCLVIHAAITLSSSARTYDNEFQPQSAIKPQTLAPELVLQAGHSMKVIAVALSPDNRILASASADNTIRLWDVVTGNELRTLNGHQGWVKSLAFSSDGKLLASGSNDRSVRIWNVDSGRELQSFAGHSAPVESLVFSRDGAKLVSGGADNTARVLDTTTGREEIILKGHTDWVTSLAFSFDGKWVATGSKDNTIRIWETINGTETRLLKGHTDRVRALAFSSDGQWLASGSFDQSVKLWKTTNGKESRSLKGSSKIIALAFSPDGSRIVAGAENKTVVAWDLQSGSVLQSHGDPSSVEIADSVSFANDTLTFVVTADKAVELYELLSGKRLQTFDSRAVGFYAVGFSPTGRWLASGSKDRTARIWDTTTGREMPALVGHTGYVTSISFSSDDRLLASASLDRTIRIWETTTGQEIAKLTGHADTIDAISFSPDTRLLASSSFDKTVRVWSVVEGRENKKLEGHTGEVTSVAFSPDGKWLASGSVDKTLRIWDTTSWANPRVIDAALRVNALAFSPDNKSIVIGSNDSTVKFLDVSSGQEVKTGKSGVGEIRGLTFSPDGRWLAVACSDETIKLWDVATLSTPKVLTGHSGSVNAVDFNGDGKWLISSSEDGTIAVWDTETTAKVATLMSFRESNDWVVVTPDGLFDGSPVSWRQILWRFAGSTFNFAPVESFFSEFYYPALLADILSGKKPRAPQDISQKDRRQPQMNVNVTTREGASGIRTVDIKIDVSEAKSDSEHRSGSGVRDVRLFRNGSLVKLWRGDVALDANGQAVLRTTVSLMAGENTFTAYAFNRDNIKSSDVSLGVVGADALKRKGTAYVVLVGINRYANAEYNLRYAVPDAQDFGAEFQQAQLKLEKYQTIELIPLLDDQATKANIMLALRRLTEGAGELPPNAPKSLEKVRVAQPEDAVVVYFAGHGTASNDGRFYLIPHNLGYDGPRTRLSAEGRQSIIDHGISDKELESAFEGIDAGQFLLVIDACNSGQALESEEKRRGPMNAKGLAQLAYEKGMYVLTAAQSYQAALEERRLGHGYLTYALVEEGLKTQAADTKPRDGMVTLPEWLDYAVGRVPQIQLGIAKDAQGRLLEHEDEKRKKTERDVQRPRVFYRLGLENKPLIVARTGAGVTTGR